MLLLVGIHEAVAVPDADQQITVAVVLLQTEGGRVVVLDLAVRGHEAHSLEATAPHDAVQRSADGPDLRGDHQALLSHPVAQVADLHEALVHGLRVTADASLRRDRDVADLDEVDAGVAVELEADVLGDGDRHDLALLADDHGQRAGDHLTDGLAIAEVTQVLVEGAVVDADDPLDVVLAGVLQDLDLVGVDIHGVALGHGGAPELVLSQDGLDEGATVALDAAEVGHARDQRVVLDRSEGLAADGRVRVEALARAPANAELLQEGHAHVVGHGHLDAEPGSAVLGVRRHLQEEHGDREVAVERLQEETAVTVTLEHVAVVQHARVLEDEPDRRRGRDGLVAGLRVGLSSVLRTVVRRRRPIHPGQGVGGAGTGRAGVGDQLISHGSLSLAKANVANAGCRGEPARGPV